MSDAGDTASASAGEIMLFGVRVVVDSIRKSVSLNNLSQYQHQNDIKNTKNDKEIIAATGYASADDSTLPRSNNRERKRGVAWTEEEHKRFLIGLKKLGKGDWRGIAKEYVMTRTPTQVASHAQKYFIRRSNVNRRRRRSSLFDITTDEVSPTQSEDQLINQDTVPQSHMMASNQTTSNGVLGNNGSQTPKLHVDTGRFPSSRAYPVVAVNPVVLTRAADVDGVMKNKLLPMEIFPIPQSAVARTRAEFDLNMSSVVDPSLSLNLSLSSSSSSSSSSSDLDRSSSSRQHLQQHGFQIIRNCGSSIMGVA